MDEITKKIQSKKKSYRTLLLRYPEYKHIIHISIDKCMPIFDVLTEGVKEYLEHRKYPLRSLSVVLDLSHYALDEDITETKALYDAMDYYIKKSINKGSVK